MRKYPFEHEPKEGEGLRVCGGVYGGCAFRYGAVFDSEIVNPGDTHISFFERPYGTSFLSDVSMKKGRGDTNVNSPHHLDYPQSIQVRHISVCPVHIGPEYVIKHEASLLASGARVGIHVDGNVVLQQADESPLLLDKDVAFDLDYKSPLHAKISWPKPLSIRRPIMLTLSINGIARALANIAEDNHVSTNTLHDFEEWCRGLYPEVAGE